jgi:hypothetical protein
VKIDVLAGHGIGAASATLAAIDGGTRLWDANSVWRSPAIRTAYGWNVLIRAAWVVALAVLSSLTVVLVLRIILGAEAVSAWNGAIAVGGVTALAVTGAAVAIRRRSRPNRRRGRGSWLWRLAGAPLEAGSARELFVGAVWEQIRGAASNPRPEQPVVGRRYSEALQENLGQPGFRELLLVATDLDARRDVIAALLRDPHRAEFLARQSANRERGRDILDLTGVSRGHALDVMTAAMTPPLLCEPELVTFAADSYWRGETHRGCDRPAAIQRLLEETANAGVTQAIVVSAVSVEGSPHRLRSVRWDPRGRLGEFLCGAEATALRDALELARLRFDSVYLIAPAHNAVGPFDLGGAYDETSDRRQSLSELMQQGYEDAYRQFIEPVVGASGDQLSTSAKASVDKVQKEYVRQVRDLDGP